MDYERIHLESASYGTRLAQIYTWRYPDRVHRNAMVAVNPPGRFWWDGAILEQQILRYSTLCGEDEYCSSRTDDLAAAIQTALDNASLYRPHTVNSEANWGFPLIAKLLLGGAVLALIVTVFLLRFFVRLGRRIVKRRQAQRL